MEIVLIFLGVLGLGAIVISAYVFTVAARNYVSNDLHTPHATDTATNRDDFVIRNPQDRRRTLQPQFPITVNSVVITRDRRENRERRALPWPNQPA